MIYFYAIASVALVFITNGLANVFQSPNSWWLIPLMLLGYFLGFVILHLLIVIVSILVVNPNNDSQKGNKYFRFIIKYTLPMVFKLCRVSIEVTGEELIPRDQRVMLVSNHFNDVDPAVMLEAFPDLELGFVAKKEVYTLFPFVAKAMKKLDCLPINRENNRDAIKTILKAVEYIKTDRASIGIFPEGYTSLDGELHDFRNGAFKIATKSGAPIVVCTLYNTQKVFKNLIKKRTTVYLDVLKVISAEEVKTMHTDEIGEIVHSAMLENLNKRKNNNE